MEQADVINALKQMTKTCCHAHILSEFKCEDGGRNTCVNKIVPVSKSEAWILCNNGPLISKYHVSGRVTERRRASGKVIDICVHPDGQLLAIVENSSSVLVCGDVNSSPIEFLNLGNYCATCMLVQEDKTVVVGIIVTQDYTQNMESFLMYFDKDRMFKCLKYLSSGNTFQCISSLTSDPFCGNLLVADRERKLVSILGDTHALSYNKTIDSGTDIPPFIPLSVSYGFSDSYFVLDGGSGQIHIINSQAEMTGFVLFSDQESEYVTPCDQESNHSEQILSCVSVDRDGRLWIADEITGKIKVFDANSFENFLESPKCTGAPPTICEIIVDDQQIQPTNTKQDYAGKELHEKDVSDSISVMNLPFGASSILRTGHKEKKSGQDFLTQEMKRDRGYNPSPEITCSPIGQSSILNRGYGPDPMFRSERIFTDKLLVGIGANGFQYKLSPDTPYRVGAKDVTMSVVLGPHGPTIYIPDTGSPQENRRMQHEILRHCKDGQVIRDSFEKHGINVDLLDIHNFVVGDGPGKPL